MKDDQLPPPAEVRGAALAFTALPAEAAEALSGQCPGQTPAVQLQLETEAVWPPPADGDGVPRLLPRQIAKMHTAHALVVDGREEHAEQILRWAAAAGRPAVLVGGWSSVKGAASWGHVHRVMRWGSARAMLCSGVAVRNRIQHWRQLLSASASSGVDAIMRHQVKDFTLSVIIAALNNADIMERAVLGLVQHAVPALRSVEIIVVDSASTDDSADAFATIKAYGVRVVRSDVSSAPVTRNVGLAAVRVPPNGDSASHLVAFLDSDMLVTSASWLHESTAVLRADTGLGAIGWAAGWHDPATMAQDSICYTMPNRGASDETRLGGYRRIVSYVGSGGLVGRLGALRDVEGFDEQFSPVGYEDTDLSFSLRARGYGVAYRFTSGILHEAHRSTDAVTDGQGGGIAAVVWRNAQRFEAKWNSTRAMFLPASDSLLDRCPPCKPSTGA
jgi:GT2 family glycosyltransferase